MLDHEKTTHKYKTFVMGNLHGDLLRILQLQREHPFSLKSYSVESSLSEREKVAREYAQSLENPQNLPVSKLGRYALESMREIQQDALKQISRNGNGNRRAIYEISTNDEDLAADNFRLLGEMTKQQSSDEFLKISRAYGIKGDQKSLNFSDEDEPDTEPLIDI